MKRTFILFATLLLLGGTKIFAQDNTQKKPTAPTDDPEYTFTYDIDEVQEIIFDRLDNPNEKNEYVKMVTADPSFPTAKGFSESDKARFKQDVRKWIEDNPGKIEKLLNEKKKYEQSKK